MLISLFFSSISPFCVARSQEIIPIFGLFLGGFFCTFVLIKCFIVFAQRWLTAQVRPFTPQAHRTKNNTPLMGGLVITSIVVLFMICTGYILNPKVMLACCTLISFGAIGFLDDWLKIQRNKGIAAYQKFLLQIGVSAFIMALVVYWIGIDTTIVFPLMSNSSVHCSSVLFLLWGIFILVGTSNAVNLTDGLDGLAVGSLIPNYLFFGFILFLSVQGAGLAAFCSVLVGALVGFAWFNAHPAQIFMSDVGSLALGAGLGYLALVSKHEMFLILTGGVFVVETLSVIAQVLSYKLRKKRLFKMSPIHHHFELCGLHEVTIVTRFTIITQLLCVVGLLVVLCTR